jgi:hypothetical protein
MSVPLDGLPPLRFLDGDDQERPRRSHSAPPTLDRHGRTLRAELGLDRPASGEGAAQ